MTAPRGIDHLRDERLWSESSYLDCVSEDGRRAFVLRLCRYPTESIAWAWLHVFLPGGVFAYNDNYATCGEALTAVDGPDAAYATADGSMLLRREGERQRPGGATASASVLAHAGRPDAPNGPGETPVTLEAAFRPLALSASNAPMRLELFGEVEAALRIGGETVALRGLGQWHEQHQKEPRFRQPFTYCTLRGPGLSLVATRGGRGRSFGYARDGARLLTVSEFDPGERDESGGRERRRPRVLLEDGRTLQGETSATYEYSVPIYDMRRPGTIVTARFGNTLLSGCLNYLPPPVS